MTDDTTLYCYWQLDMFFVYEGKVSRLESLRCFGSRRHLLEPAIVDHEYDLLLAKGVIQPDRLPDGHNDWHEYLSPASDDRDDDWSWDD